MSGRNEGLHIEEVALNEDDFFRYVSRWAESWERVSKQQDNDYDKGFAEGAEHAFKMMRGQLKFIRKERGID